MYNHRCGAKENHAFSKDSYNCSTYTLSRRRETRGCTSHCISTQTVRTLLLDTIRTVSRYAIENEAEFEQKVREACQVRHIESAKELKARLRKSRKRCEELDVLIRKLYEAYALEKITEKRFDELLADYENEQAELLALMNAEQADLDTCEASTENTEAFMALARKYRDVEELTTPMIYDFVDKIIVHAPQKINGERHMRVEVILRFIGNFQVPRPDPTQEEIEQAEKDRQRRAKNRERDARRRAKKLAEQQKKEHQTSYENG